MVTNECLRNFTWGPSRLVISFNGYIVNGYRFHTSDYAERKKIVNSDVCMKGIGNDASGSDYYGVLNEISSVS
jgi:hypothetical protein